MSRPVPQLSECAIITAGHRRGKSPATPGRGVMLSFLNIFTLQVHDSAAKSYNTLIITVIQYMNLQWKPEGDRDGQKADWGNGRSS